MNWKGLQWWKHWSRSSLAFAIGLVMATGCSLNKEVENSRYQQALHLVDQGTILLRERKFEESDAAFAMAAELAPVAAAVDGRGCVALLRTNFYEAEKYFMAAYEMDPQYDEALGNLALLYDLQGERSKARALYEKFLVERPDIVAARNNYAVSLFEGGVRQALVKSELQKAASLSNNAVISDNIRKLEFQRN